MIYPKKYDCIVIGAGHAGVESALACARMNAQTLLVTINMDTVSLMPCNPSIGGPAKGHITREIDALGGEMAKIIDKTHMHIRMLNTGKGPAVQALRAQADKVKYQRGMKFAVEECPNLDLKQETACEILTENQRVTGIKTLTGWIYRGDAVIVTTGTFLKGLIVIGDFAFPAGRAGEFPSNELSDSLASLGLQLGRLKTGTVPRIDRRTIDYSQTTPQHPSADPLTFSFDSPLKVMEDQQPCYLTYTTKATKDIIMANLHRSPLYGDDAKIKIQGTGPRYCPSIETKLMRFPDKEQHQVFLEPEGRDTLEIYVQGLSTSLPVDVQYQYIQTVMGLEKAEIMRPGYAIEYDFVFPTQLKPNLETRKIKNLFLAGQINGTSGYEEAGCQGLMAGINAVLSLSGKEPLILTRDTAYTGVLIDDLVTLGTEEPYRMLTSRAEYRLNLRQDNADERLTPLGYKVGLISEERYHRFLKKMNNIKNEMERLRHRRVKSHEAEIFSQRLKTPISPGTSFYDLLKRVEVDYKTLTLIDPWAPLLLSDDPYLYKGKGSGKKEPDIRHFIASSTGDREIGDEIIAEKLNSGHYLNPREVEQIEINIKYEGYIRRQEEQINKFRKMEKILIPEDLDYSKIKSLKIEAREKLQQIRPANIGQASRISGVTPSDVSVILIALNQSRVSL